jgi:hypothetical protein
MKQHSGIVLGWVTVSLVVVMLACSGATPTPPSQVLGDQPTSVVILITATPQSGDTPVPPTVDPTAVQSEGCTLNMAYVADVTIPDGTVLAPGTAFLKTWRVQNTGTCDWKDGTQLVLTDGDQMRGPAAVSVPVTPPNGTADISVNLSAPAAPGRYVGRWRMRSPDGTIYGSLTVVIVIPATPTVTATALPTPTETPTMTELYNFHDKASTASWSSISGTLTFPGAETDARGYVMFQDYQKLDDGTVYRTVLETHPTWVTGGFIQGIYTVGDIRSGDHFRAKVGLLYGEGATVGAVTFIVRGGDGTTLGSFGDTRDGAIVNIDLDLAPIVGKTNQIILRVEANNPDAAQDWACWVNPRLFGVR